MGLYRCMICDDKVACRAIDEELAKGMTGAATARLMTLRGFSVTPETVNGHAKHRIPAPPPGVAKQKRDLALLVRDKVHERVQKAVDDDELDDVLFTKGGQGAIAAGLKAEAIIDKREARVDDKKNVLKLAILLAGGGQLTAPADLIGDGLTIEGEYEDVTGE